MKLSGIQDPVPSDIDIAQGARLLPISQIATAVDLLEDEVDTYGKYKAKAGPSPVLLLVLQQDLRCCLASGLLSLFSSSIQLPLTAGTNFSA